MLMQNHYPNLNSLHLCFPIKTRKSTNNDIDEGMINVNNFLTHRIEEIKVTRYCDDVEIISTSSPDEVYQYSDVMLKIFARDLANELKHYYFTAKKS